MLSRAVLFTSGIHTYCTPGCASREELAPDLDDTRPTTVDRGDIFNIPELQEDGPPTGVGTVNDGEDGLPHTADSGDYADSKKKCGNGGAKGSSKGGEKKALKPCVGSKFTAASLRQSLDDSISLAVVKMDLWTRVLKTLLTWRDREHGLSEGPRSDEIECIHAFEKSVRSVTKAAEKIKSSAENARRTLAISCARIYGVSMFTLRLVNVQCRPHAP